MVPKTERETEARSEVAEVEIGEERGEGLHVSRVLLKNIAY